MKVDKGLLGGSTVLMLLALLAESDKYGYEIIKELDVRSESEFQFKEGTLYPVLHKLENSGLLKSYVAKSDSGKERRYYQITKNGLKQLSEEKDKWEVFSKSVNKVIGGEAHALV